MAKIGTLLTDGDDIIDKAENGVLNSLDEAEAAIFKEILKIFDQADISSGKFVKSDKAKKFLQGLDGRIMDALYNSKYRLGVSNLLKDYDKIVQNNIDLQGDLNKVNVSKKSLGNIQTLEVNNTVDRLLGSGLNNNFVIPVRQSLYRNVMLGASVADAKQAIEDYIISKDGQDSSLRRYVGQAARDSIMQFDGSIQESIATELELSNYVYTGSIIKDSRDQCIYWVNRELLISKDLEGEIADAIAGESLTGLRPCSGMNPSTTMDTFAIYRGGYNCRHRAIPTDAGPTDILGVKKANEVRDFPKDEKLKGDDAKLQDKSIAYFVNNKDKLVNDYIKEFGNTANTDDARKLFKDIGYNGTNASAVHEASSALNKEVVKKLIKESESNIVEMYAGGAGSGKTSAIAGLSETKAEDVAAIIDGNMASYTSAVKKIDQFLGDGKAVNISYVYRDPLDAWENGVIKRMLDNPKEGGRAVPLSTFLENTEGSYKTISKMYETGLDKIPNVNVRIIDNSLGKGNTAFMDRKKFDSIKFDDALKQKLLKRTKELLDSGRITKAQYNALIQ